MNHPMEDCALKTWCLTGGIIEKYLGHNDPILNAELVHNGFITMQGAQVIGSQQDRSTVTNRQADSLNSSQFS